MTGIINTNGPQMMAQDGGEAGDNDADFRSSQVVGPNEIGNLEDQPDYLSHQQSVQMNAPFANLINQPMQSRSPNIKPHPMKNRVSQRHKNQAQRLQDQNLDQAVHHTTELLKRRFSLN